MCIYVPSSLLFRGVQEGGASRGGKVSPITFIQSYIIHAVVDMANFMLKSETFNDLGI